MAKKELSEAQKEALRMKYEIAEELGLTEKIRKVGWKGLSAKESGRVGGLMGKRRQQQKKEQQKAQSEKAEKE